MTDAGSSFHRWLLEQITMVLGKGSAPQSLVVWCDRDREWLGMLRLMSAQDGFELWADPEEHELEVRDRFYLAERTPRVVWLPCSRDEISWFKVFELQAEYVWERSLLQALRDYGVSIPRESEEDLLPLLPAHAQEWFDNPKDTWRELTPGAAKGTLVDDYRMLQVVAGGQGEFDLLKEEKRFDIFARRSVEDFGFPDPANMGEDEWRIAVTARLLVTEAADTSPAEQPSDQDKVIVSGLQRERALKLLMSWQQNIHFIASFERLSRQADRTTSLSYWAHSLSVPPGSKGSRAVEETLFKGYVEKLDRITAVDDLNQELADSLSVFLDRQSGFWSAQADDKVGWMYLVTLGEAASLLVESSSTGDQWKSAQDAVSWFTQTGWQLDHAGETLFQEQSDLPSELQRIRARVRRSYLRTTDRIGRVFSELLDKDPKWSSELPTSGEVALGLLQGSSTPTAIMFIDALRYDLGERLAEMLNTGESMPRASVSAAAAPVPSITSLGMAFALPIPREQLSVRLDDQRKAFMVSAEGFAGDLSVAADRRKWLGALLGVKNFYTVADIIEGRLKSSTRPQSLVIIEGTELDVAGHPGDLQVFGTTDLLDRYARAMRLLRENGYSRIIVVTDHGFFHWQPEEDEIEETKPEGEILWSSRRAIVGRHLSHASALTLDIPQSDLQVAVPRSMNAFKTYGGLGYFHGGATLQESVTPVVVAVWPPKATKISVVLKPVEKIVSEAPRVQVQRGISGQSRLFGADENDLPRRVVIKIQERDTGRIVFRHDEPVTVEPNEELITVQLGLVEPHPPLPRGAIMTVVVLDADDEEILDREEVQLKVDIDEW